MNGKKVSDYISEVYRDLPIRMRVRVNMAASELLEIQRKNKALFEDRKNLSSYDDRKNGK